MLFHSHAPKSLNLFFTRNCGTSVLGCTGATVIWSASVCGLNRIAPKDFMHFARRIFLRLTVLTIAAVLCPSTIHAQSALESCSNAANPGDLSLHLTLKNGKKVFREGEIITLTAEYRACGKRKYSLNNKSYDRIGRLEGMEVFHIEPNSGVDPLTDYFKSRTIFSAGGLYSDQDLNEKPFAIDVELNEWQSLPPGTYRLSITGHRVSAKNEKDPLALDGKPFPLNSNAVEFQVVKADAEWQAAELAAAIRGLDSLVSTENQKQHALRVLRFLGSEASTRQLARRYGSAEKDINGEMMFGLFGSPFRASAVEAMQAEIKDPLHPVTRQFVNTLVSLEMQSESKYRGIPLNEFDDKDPYTAEFNRRTAVYMAEADALIPQKSKMAQALSASDHLQFWGTLTPEAKANWRHVLLSTWDSLPVDVRNELIRDQWNEVGGPEWLPVLKGIVFGESYAERYSNTPDRTEALVRIRELSAAEARPLILAEVGAARGDIGIEGLGSLPERELPQFDEAMIAKISSKDATNLDFEILDRYASPSVLAKVQAIYKNDVPDHGWVEVPQAAMLRYFLRADPAYGVKEATKALQERKITDGEWIRLDSLKEYIRIPQLEQLAIAQLDNPSPEARWDATKALQHYGSPHAEAALWARLEKYHKQWKGTTPHSSNQAIDIEAEKRFEGELVDAITQGQGWFANEDTILSLKALCSPERQADLDRILETLRSHEYSLLVSWWPDGELNFGLAWYSGSGLEALKEKLKQLPAGSQLNNVTSAEEQIAHRDELLEAAKAAKAHGLSLPIRTPK
jgi:hypothetical protein